MTLSDQIARSLERSVEVIESHLIAGMLPIHPNYIVAKSDERHVNGLDSSEQVWINCARENDAVNQAMLLKNGRQIDVLRSDPRRIVKHSKQDVMLQAASIRLDTLQNARVKGMEEIAVAQKKANNLGASLENSTGLRVRPEPQTADGFIHAGARFPAHLRAGIQDSRDRSYAYARGPGHVANRALAWNCFQPYIGLS